MLAGVFQWGLHHIEHSGNPLGDLSIPRGFRRTRHNRQKKVIVACVSFNQVSPANCSLVLPYGSFIDYFFLTTCGILGFFSIPIVQLCCLQFGASCHFGAILRNYSKLPCIYIRSFPFSPFSFCPMASPIPNVLIAVHSFVKRLHSDLQCKFDHHAAVDFNLSQTANVSL